MNSFKPGDRVQTKSGRLGILQSPTVNMSAHHLIQFDDGPMLWVIKEAVESVQPKKSLDHHRKFDRDLQIL